MLYNYKLPSFIFTVSELLLVTTGNIDSTAPSNLAPSVFGWQHACVDHTLTANPGGLRGGPRSNEG